MAPKQTATGRTSNRCPIEPRPTDVERYVSHEVGEGEVVVSDTEREDAWIRSDSAIRLESME